MEVWLSDLTHDQQTIAADTMPTNIGYIASYLKYNLNKNLKIRLFKYPGKLIDAIDTAKETGQYPAIVGLSNFIWNARLSYKFAEKIKSLKPETVVVFGGLNYPNEAHKQKKWLEDHPLVDFHVYKEGERGFFNLVENLLEDKFVVSKTKQREIAGVHFLRNDNSVHSPAPAPRIEDLTSFPSPFLSGILDEFFDGRLMPIVTTNRGCPFSCSFCTEGISYYSKVNRSNLDRVSSELRYMAEKIIGLNDPNAQHSIYISDSNFGMFKEDIEVCHVLKDLRDKQGWPKYILATTGKNSKERVLDAANLLGGGLKLSGSVQSLDKEVQKNIRRENINTDSLLMVAKAAGKIGADSYSEIILGLPGDSLKGHEYSLKKIINAGYDLVMTWQLIILPETDLATDGNIEKYQMKSRYRALTKSYGNYFFKDGDCISVSEIEDICVEGINLHFEDYLEVRKLHQIINTFYNNRVFDSVLKILDYCKVDRFSWVKECLNQYNRFPTYAKLLENFIEETKNELWSSKEELIKFVDNRENIEKYVDGTYGANLIFKYKIQGLSEFFDEICEIARSAALTCLKSVPGFNSTIEGLLNDLIVFEKERKKGIFDLHLQDSVVDFSYDVLKFIEDETIKPLQQYSLSQKQALRFYRSEDTLKLIKQNHKLYGSSAIAKYKQITRVPLPKLYRTALKPAVERIA